MIYKIVACIWFISACIWPFTAYWHFKAGMSGTAAFDIAIGVMFAAIGGFYLMI